MTEESVKDEDFSSQFVRTMFSNRDDEEDSDHEAISEHVWNCGDVSIIYHLAFLAPGHGDSVWNSSECIALHLSLYRKKLFGEEIERQLKWPPKKALEFGAGAALPSMVLFKEGSKVVCTDGFTNEDTFEALELSFLKNSKQWGIEMEEKKKRTMVVPHSWGEEIEKLQNDSDGSDFDVLVASDCIYDPTYHQALLESAVVFMAKENGLFIVGYSFHMNVPPAQVLKFFDQATVEFDLKIVSEFTQEYPGQLGIGNQEPMRGAVYVKVLAHIDSIYCRRQ